MTNKKIAIRCITDEKKGFGNLNRSIILATYLRLKGKEIVFLINNSYNAIIHLKKLNFKFILLPKNLKISEEPIFLNEFLSSLQIKFIIIDMREFSEILSKKLKKYNFKILILDDAWCKNIYADILVNPTPILQYHKYKKINKNCKLFLGPKFWMIQKNFKKYIKPVSEIKFKKKYNVVITMGGSDPYNITQKILESLKYVENINLIILFGPFFEKNKIKEIKNIYTNLKFYHNPTNPLIIFKKSDIAISSGGNTLFELAMLGIPTICIPIIKHQIPYSEFFENLGFSINLGKWNTKKSVVLKENLIFILKNIQIRKNMSKIGRKFSDGNGGFRISTIIDEC